MIKKILFVCILMFFGCATFNDLRLFDGFDKAAQAYESAILWGDFEVAAGFLSKQNPGKKGVLPDKNLLKKIKVTAYELRNLKADNVKMTVQQNVEIKYYNTNNYIEKMIQDNQIWVYESNSWRLTTGLPAFE